MGILRIKSSGFELELTTDDIGACQLSGLPTTTDATPQQPDRMLDIALIAMALHDAHAFDSEIHDRESGRITIVNRPTEWSSKIFGLNKGIK